MKCRSSTSTWPSKVSPRISVMLVSVMQGFLSVGGALTGRTPNANRDERSDGEALAAAAGAFGVGVFEHEPGCKVILAPVHGRADQIEDGGAVDVEGAARRLDLLVELRLLADIVDRISEARAAAPRRRQLDADRAFRRLRHQFGDPRLGGGREDDGGRARPDFR